MSRTPFFDAQLKALLDATAPGERLCPISSERWMLSQEDLDRCRAWNVPPPAYAPRVRMQLVAGWGAGIDLWWKPEMQSGKPMLSIVHPDTPSPIVSDREWYRKDWGAEAPLNVEIDRPLFDQARALFDRVPY